jgi:hypothetical protein
MLRVFFEFPHLRARAPAFMCGAYQHAHDHTLLVPAPVCTINRLTFFLLLLTAASLQVADAVAYWRDVFLPEFYDKHLPRLNSLPQFKIQIDVRSHVRPYPQRVLGPDRLPHLPLLNSLPQFTVRVHVRAALAACHTSRCSTHFSRTPFVLTTYFVTEAIKWCGVCEL